MKITQIFILIAGLIFLFITENIAKTIKGVEEDKAKEQNLKDIIKENKKLNETISKLKEIIRNEKYKIQMFSDENERIKNQIFKKKEELNSVKKKKLGGSDNKKQNNIAVVNEDNSALLNVKMVKSVIDKFSDFQVFNLHVQNQFQREKDLRQTLNEKLKELYKTETKLDSVYNNIESLFTGRISELSKKISTLERSHFDMDKRIRNLELEKEQQQDVRSKIRKGLIKPPPDNNKFLGSSEFVLFDFHNCDSKSNCHDCLNEKSCVWCNLEKKCLPGGVNGPSDGSCTTSFVIGTCPGSICDSYNSCNKCVENEICGWCPEKAKCYEGNQNGPNDIICNKFRHMNNQNKCSPNIG